MSKEKHPQTLLMSHFPVVHSATVSILLNNFSMLLVPNQKGKARWLAAMLV